MSRATVRSKASPRLAGLALVAAVWASSCASSGDPAVDGSLPADAPSLLPAASDDLVLDLEDGLIPLALVDELRRLTGLVVLVDDETRMALAQGGRLYLAGPAAGETTLRIPRADVVPFVERLLRRSRCVLFEVHAADPQTVRLVSLDTNHRSWVQREAEFVPADELERYRDHPAILVTTLLATPGDAHAPTVAQLMRLHFMDRDTQTRTALSDYVLLLTDYGPDLADLVKLLRASGMGGAEVAAVAALPVDDGVDAAIR